MSTHAPRTPFFKHCFANIHTRMSLILESDVLKLYSFGIVI